jgi:hypothetical protein
MASAPLPNAVLLKLVAVLLAPTAVASSSVAWLPEPTAVASTAAVVVEFAPHSVLFAPVPLLHGGVGSAEAATGQHRAVVETAAKSARRMCVIIRDPPVFRA